MDSKQIRKKAAYEFMSVWREKNWNALKNHCQPSWAERQIDTPEILMGMLGGINVLKWRYVDEKKVGDNCYDVILICHYYKRGKNRRTVLLRLINEDDWGVNPVSVLRKF